MPVPMNMFVRALITGLVCVLTIRGVFPAEASHPLRVAVFIDRGVVGSVDEALGRASELFFQNSGRSVVFISGDDVDIPRELMDGAALSGERGIAWIGTKKDVPDADVVILITDKFIAHDRMWGDGLARHTSALVRYGNIRQAVNVILHELGHYCGAGHSSDPASIMHERSYAGTHFGEWTEHIRGNCGHPVFPEAALVP
ncbi:MAG: hypothetical protein A3B29_04390 [Candidatus Sungbacteria bacterium RIFCSPLOWO2_01_FULL_51_34]|uniref:Peptidase M10 metallopeptidase domain-containing protein n=1 Tax=Candidatus Sungbacteria bacterium RIFCSPHIGHO2_02_FULL_51_29 TaxID=1802273 RepID=A0A1G2KW82_9BACT|nr:MAG: hypothetical protein A3C16_01550 [Candidatus Sungbacteria bacterium RIFCSPHIGHO2_02_FULL_51_29]OHA05499.1 MAG: hypothetical protein A3B29_04390 [Candidatus Sungbacteria bacterium RIFCSPLOWO2_01_FULL_51_34]